MSERLDSERINVRNALVCAFGRVIKRFHEAAHEDLSLTRSVHILEVVNNVGLIIGSNDDEMGVVSLYEYLRTAYDNEGALVIAMDRVGTFFEGRLRHHEEKNLKWSAFTHTQCAVKAMNRMTSRSGPPELQLVVILVSYEWKRACNGLA